MFKGIESLIVIIVFFGGRSTDNGLFFKSRREFGRVDVIGCMGDYGVGQGRVAIEMARLMDCSEVVGSQVSQKIDLKLGRQMMDVIHDLGCTIRSYFVVVDDWRWLWWRSCELRFL